LGNFWAVIVGIASIILVIFAAIPTFHLFGSDSQQPIVVVKVNSTSPNTGGSITAATADTTNGKTIVSLSSSSSLVDDFYTDTQLNTQLWTTNGEVAKRVIEYFNGIMTSPSINFQTTGLEIGGFNNQHEAVALQSVNGYSPPFILTTQVQIPSKNVGSFLGLYTSDLKNHVFATFYNEYANECYVGYSTTAQPQSQALQYPAVSQNLCSIKISVDSLGTGTIEVEGKTIPIVVGKGYFYVIINEGQYGETSNPEPGMWTYVHLIPNNTP
jgi:hypothetical protein